ncbi:MAG: hypothetical protein A2275_18520 [Bacteroidetes bacterium RIFOXYA12_FULL_35_11]|nr:MAG: hypothetical protein A2X01_02075 [Bacteroidetes bacterium GWF2_35_48]OFY83606.1 MAG: hypothetical protein A2275_18520 [Bacteroidetes bacterium RIFOXYA12_FULL_35_11]OFY92708.1 MAG: hypothetical protein A2491_21100 [Bacteroidetes bacterium RIFOXYC12_FULL_35_7]HBX51935.1 hypothetical protein [Bacteroidales bacterium]
MQQEFKHVDISFLKNMTSDDPLIMSEIIQLFKMEVPKYLHDIYLHLNSKNWNELSAAAHKAKSSFALMGINESVSNLKDLEIKSKNQIEIETFTSLVQNIERVYHEAMKELEPLI